MRPSRLPSRMIEGDKVLGTRPQEPPWGCRFYTRCPVAIDRCGWTADEVAEALDRLLQARYPDLASKASIRVLNESAFLVIGLNEQQVKDIVGREAEQVRALTAVKSVTRAGNGVKVEVTPYEDPKMIEVSRDHYAACHLLQPGH